MTAKFDEKKGNRAEKEETRNDKSNISIAAVDSNETLDYIEHGVCSEK